MTASHETTAPDDAPTFSDVLIARDMARHAIERAQWKHQRPDPLTALRSLLASESSQTFSAATDWRSEYDRLLSALRALDTPERPTP